MVWRIFVSFLTLIGVCVPAMLLSVPIVAVLLRTKWDGRSTIFGNAKWGRATDHPDHPTKENRWLEFNWLVLRNPVNNLSRLVLGLKKRRYTVRGSQVIGDKISGGFYAVRMGWAWEFYGIIPYTLFGRRCIRVRIGWKILNSDTPCQFCFVINPVKTYSGA